MPSVASRRSLPQLDRLTQDIYSAFSSNQLSREDIVELKHILDGLLHAAPTEMMQEEPEPIQSAKSQKGSANGSIIPTWRTDSKTKKIYGPYLELRYYKGSANGVSQYGRKYLGKPAAGT